MPLDEHHSTTSCAQTTVRHGATTCTSRWAGRLAREDLVLHTSPDGLVGSHSRVALSMCDPLFLPPPPSPSVFRSVAPPTRRDSPGREIHFFVPSRYLSFDAVWNLSGRCFEITFCSLPLRELPAFRRFVTSTFGRGKLCRSSSADGHGWPPATCQKRRWLRFGTETRRTGAAIQSGENGVT